MAGKDVILTTLVKDEELPTYYAACDYYITASVDECFNLPAAEAQACGKPIIAFDIGSHSEVVKKGKGSILIPERDIKGLGNAMFRVTGSV